MTDRAADSPPIADCTSYARAAAGYDAEHERALLEAITTAIFKTSMCTDANVAAIRTGECASALLTALASIMALSPSATRSPSQIRKTIDQLGKRLRKRLAAAEADQEVQEFARRCFRGNDVRGTA